METTAINTVYVVILIVSEKEIYVDIDREYNEGWVKYVFARKDEAEKICKEFNERETNPLKYWKVSEFRLL